MNEPYFQVPEGFNILNLFKKTKAKILLSFSKGNISIDYFEVNYQSIVHCNCIWSCVVGI